MCIDQAQRILSVIKQISIVIDAYNLNNLIQARDWKLSLTPKQHYGYTCKTSSFKYAPEEIV